MKTLTLVTRNNSKFKEFKAILEPLGYAVDNERLELVEPKTLDQVEVAISTARQAYEKLHRPLVTDDTGIFFESYISFPGTYTKFLFQAVGFGGIKRIMTGVSKRAFYQTTLCFTDGEFFEVFQGRLEGKVALRRLSDYNKDWVYDSIFVPVGSSKYFSEYSLQERQQVSHRAKAIGKLANFLSLEYYKENK